MNKLEKLLIEENKKEVLNFVKNNPSDESSLLFPDNLKLRLKEYLELRREGTLTDKLDLK